MTDEEIDFMNKIFARTNVKMYSISFNILRNKFDAEEAAKKRSQRILKKLRIYYEEGELNVPNC